MSEKQLNNPLAVTVDAKLFGKLGNEFGEFDVSDVPTLGTGGRLRNIVYMTASGVYEKPAWLKFVRVKGVGGGGASGGAPATNASQASIGAGGGAGGYFEKLILAENLLESEVVTIGAAGAGVSGNTGNNGGATSFGTHCTAGGGSGGAKAGPSAGHNVAGPTPGGVATGGDINIRGATATKGVVELNGGLLTYSNYGGASMFSGYASLDNGALGYGGGGGGRINWVSAGASVGNSGSPGIVIIEEYE
jgi:hypothetical protein